MSAKYQRWLSENSINIGNNRRNEMAMAEMAYQQHGIAISVIIA